MVASGIICPQGDRWQIWVRPEPNQICAVIFHEGSTEQSEGEVQKGKFTLVSYIFSAPFRKTSRIQIFHKMANWQDFLPTQISL